MHSQEKYFDLDPHGDLATAEVGTPLTDQQWKDVKARLVDVLDKAAINAERTAGCSIIGVTVYEILGLLAAHFRR